MDRANKKREAKNLPPIPATPPREETLKGAFIEGVQEHNSNSMDKIRYEIAGAQLDYEAGNYSQGTSHGLKSFIAAYDFVIWTPGEGGVYGKTLEAEEATRQAVLKSDTKEGPDAIFNAMDKTLDGLLTAHGPLPSDTKKDLYALKGVVLAGRGVFGAGDAARDRDWGKLVDSSVMVADGLLQNVNACESPKVVEALKRAREAVKAVQAVRNAGKAIDDEQFGKAVQELTAAFTHLDSLLDPCFAAGTPLLTPKGDKPIEQFKRGDEILSRNEHSVDSPAVVGVVEEVFVRSARILHLHVAGQVIRTTAEHPFWLYNAGWMAAGKLQAGDLLSSHDGQWVAVEEVYDTGEDETVYNLRVSEHHTYFVGGSDWGFSVWAHNACQNFSSIAEHVEGDVKTLGLPGDKAGRVALRQQLRNEFGQSPDTKVAYVLYDRTTGEVYKVGKTSVGPDARNLNERFVNVYARGQEKLAASGVNVDLAVDYAVLKPSSLQNGSAQTFESALRTHYESRGFSLPWDNSKVEGVGYRLGFSGSGLPWENLQSLGNWLPNRLTGSQ